MNPLKAKKLSYLRAQASLLRSSGPSVQEIAKVLEKSERWVVKWSSRAEDFEDKKRSGRPKILSEVAKNVLEKVKYKRRKSTRQLSQRLASKGLSGLKKLCLEFPEKQRLENSETAEEATVDRKTTRSSIKIRQKIQKSDWRRMG